MNYNNYNINSYSINGNGSGEGYKRSPYSAENSRKSNSLLSNLGSSSLNSFSEIQRTSSYSSDKDSQSSQARSKATPDSFNSQSNRLGDLVYKPVFANAEQQTFQTFLFNTCSPYVNNVNHDFIAKLQTLLPLGSYFYSSQNSQTLPNLKIKAVQNLPFYKGSALGITTMSSKKRKTLFKFGLEFNQNQLQWNLLKLYFSYFNPFFFVIHPAYFYRQLMSKRADKSFRFLLLVVLSLATSYLHIEPIEGSPDPGELCESYLNEAMELFMELKHIASPNTLIATILLCNSNYSKINTSLQDAWQMANQLGFTSFFNASSEEIFKTMPDFPPNGPPTDQYLEWEQNLILWCNLIFNCLLSSLAGMPVQVPVESSFLDITNVINVLYYENRVKCFAEPDELEVLKFTYLLDPIFLDILRFRNTYSQQTDTPSKLSLLNQERELKVILNSMKNWDFNFSLSIKNFKSNNFKLNIITGTAFRFRQFATLFLTTPYLEVIQYNSLSSLRNPYLLDDGIFWELSSNCISMILSCWAEGNLFSLIGSGIRNYMLFVAWACAQTIFKLLDQTLINMKEELKLIQEQQRNGYNGHQQNDYLLNSAASSASSSNLSQINSLETKIEEYTFLKHVFTAIIPLPLKSLLKSIPMSFHHRPIDLLLEQQSAHFWCLVNPQHKKMLAKYITIGELKYMKNSG
jgi:hypothetical protein